MATRRRTLAILLLLLGAAWGAVSLAHAGHDDDPALCAICATSHALELGETTCPPTSELATGEPVAAESQSWLCAACLGLPDRRGPPFHG